jgi:hypothetical protein
MSFLQAINFPNKLWNGSSRTRTSADGPIGGIHRTPDGDDYAQICQEVIAMQTQMGVPFQTIPHAATISWDPTKGLTVKISPTGDETISAASGGIAGQRATFILVNDGSVRTITFSTNFKPSATLAGSANKTATIEFRSDGTNWYETNRTTGL